MHHSQHFSHFKMHPGSLILWGSSALPVILPQSPQLNLNGNIFSWEKQRKVTWGQVRRVRWVVDDNHVAFGKKIPWERKCETMHCHDANNQFFSPESCTKCYAHLHPLHEMFHTDSQDMLVLSPTIASHYYNCCTDGNTSLRNYQWQ
jgi:hypothetical protein